MAIHECLDKCNVNLFPLFETEHTPIGLDPSQGSPTFHQHFDWGYTLWNSDAFRYPGRWDSSLFCEFESSANQKVEDVGVPFRRQSIVFEPVVYCDFVHPVYAPFKSTERRRSVLPFLLPRSFISRHSRSTEDSAAMNPNWRSEIKSFSLIHWIIARRIQCRIFIKSEIGVTSSFLGFLGRDFA